MITVQGLLQEDGVRAFLASHGIPSRVRTQSAHQIHAINVDGMGAATILVPADRADEARELLAQVERGELELPEDEDPPAPSS